jgi:hypothetical protein
LIGAAGGQLRPDPQNPCYFLQFAKKDDFFTIFSPQIKAKWQYNTLVPIDTQ